MHDSRSERIYRFAEMHTSARIAAGKSQEFMAFELGVSKKTVSNWEKGTSSPSFFQSLEWFRVLNTNPFPYFLKMLYPNTIKGVKPTDSDEKIEEAFDSLVSNLSIADKRALLYLYNGDHGSSPYSVIQLILSHLHSPITSRIANAILVCGNYEVNKNIGSLICNENIQPDITNLHNAIKKAEYAAVHNGYGYTNINDYKEEYDDIKKEDG